MIKQGIQETLETIIKKEDNNKFHVSRKVGKFVEVVDTEKASEGLTQKRSKILSNPTADL
jgi:hypothetical protein